MGKACALWCASVRCSWWKDVVFTGSYRGFHICTSLVIQKKESDEIDAGGKRSCTERGLCRVVPVIWQIWSAKNLVGSTNIYSNGTNRVWNTDEFIRSENFGKRFQIPNSYSDSREMRFWATGDSYTRLQYLFQIFKRTISQVVPEVYQAIAEAMMANIQVKNCVLYRANSFAHKIDGLKQWKKKCN